MALNRLKAARMQKDMTQDQAAKELGMSRVTYEAVENKRRVPWPRFRAAAAELFGKSEDWLFGKPGKERVG